MRTKKMYTKLTESKTDRVLNNVEVKGFDFFEMSFFTPCDNIETCALHRSKRFKQNILNENKYLFYGIVYRDFLEKEKKRRYQLSI